MPSEVKIGAGSLTGKERFAGADVAKVETYRGIDGLGQPRMAVDQI